ncbi:MAG: hypothetical protein KGL46_07620 [Hyphomicrobiales bacterium]|nr:hypothetical protein [Hyphomicrobiales bacterium]
MRIVATSLSLMTLAIIATTPAVGDERRRSDDREHGRFAQIEHELESLRKHARHPCKHGDYDHDGDWDHFCMKKISH